MEEREKFFWLGYAIGAIVMLLSRLLVDWLKGVL
jgi:hypothetical protein